MGDGSLPCWVWVAAGLAVWAAFALWFAWQVIKAPIPPQGDASDFEP